MKPAIDLPHMEKSYNILATISFYLSFLYIRGLRRENINRHIVNYRTSENPINWPKKKLSIWKIVSLVPWSSIQIWSKYFIVILIQTNIFLYECSSSNWNTCQSIKIWQVKALKKRQSREQILEGEEDLRPSD